MGQCRRKVSASRGDLLSSTPRRTSRWHPPHYSQEDAEREAGEILANAQRRGTSATLTITNRDTGNTYPYPKGESEAMAKSTDTPTKLDVTTEAGATAIEQIDANIERARALAQDDNPEALEELGKETETLISALSGKGSIIAKKDRREAWRKALEEAQSAAQTSAEVVAARDYTAYEGVEELVSMGAERAAEGARLHIRTSTTAKEIASIILDMWRRIPDKNGNPDITGTSDPAKKASSAMYKAVGEALAKDGLDAFDVETAVKKLIRSVQTQRTDVRAEYLRSLDNDSPEAEEERKHFSALIGTNTAGGPVSEFLAAYYGVGLKGEIEKSRERYHQKKELGASASGEASDGEDEATPDEKVQTIVRSFMRDVQKAVPDDFEKASDEVKQAVREDLLKIAEALKGMISATL